MQAQSGKFDQPITIQSVTTSVDSMGSVTEIWAEISGAPKWAEYIPLTGREFIEAGKLEIKTDLKLKIRRNSSVNPKCQIIHKTKTYRITGIQDYQRDNCMILHCGIIE